MPARERCLDRRTAEELRPAEDEQPHAVAGVAEEVRLPFLSSSTAT